MNLPEEIKVEFENIDKVLELLKIVLEREDKSEIELSATATYLHNIYNGVENSLKIIFKMNNFSLPSSKNWHRDLLLNAEYYKIISTDLREHLQEYLAFRHFFVHSYGFMLKEELMVNLTSKVPAVIEAFKEKIYEWFEQSNE